MMVSVSTTTSMMQQTSDQSWKVHVRICAIEAGEMGAYLKPADQSVLDFSFEKIATLVILACPAPHVLAVAIYFA